MNMTAETQDKSGKGTVIVEEFQGRLRLRWRVNRKRYTFSVGLADTKINRRVAQQKATQIELDIISGHFDPTLKRYKPQLHTQNTQISVATLFERFMLWKAKAVLARSMEKYEATHHYLQEFYKNKAAETLGLAEAEKFLDWLQAKKLSAIVCRERLTLVKAAWTWASKEGLVTANPWTEMVGRIKIPPKQMPKPFTRAEITSIIQTFKTDQYYAHYADYVAFLFATGCRTSEAIGLRWKHLSGDCSSVWIGETLARGVRKATKTNRARTITLTPNLQAMLLARRPEEVDGEVLVFQSLRGGPIDDHNFRNRAWVSILTQLGIDYRKPYTTRHTLISHALDLGMNPVMVAQLTGHDVQTLYQNYAGSVNSRPRLPEL